MSKTLTRLFDTYADAERAVRELETMGVPHNDISIVANDASGEHGRRNGGAGSTIDHAAGATERFAEHPVTSTEHGVEHAADAVGSTLAHPVASTENAFDKAGHAVGRAADAVGHAVAHPVASTEHVFGEAGDGVATAAPDHDGDISRGASTGALLGGGAGLLAGLGMLAVPGLGPVVAAGWLISTLAGAGIGAAGGAATGTVVGSLKNAGHTDEEANVYSEGIRRGSTLVSARVPDSLASEAAAMFERYNGVDAATRGEAYRSSGWSRFDDTAPAYSSDQIAEERARYSRM